MNYLLDTCLVSELIKKKPIPSVVRWLDSVEENHLFLSVLTVGEIQKGISKLEDNVKKKTLQKWLSVDLKLRFEKRLLEINDEVALKWGELTGKLEKKGIKIPVIDALLSATALVHGLTIVTRNGIDMHKTETKIFNPWG